MPKITFDQLIPIYRGTAFNATRTGGRIRIGDHAVLETLKFISEDEDAFSDSGIRIVDDPGKLILENEIEIEIDAPRLGLGVLARDVDGIIAAPAYRIAAPQRYYLIEERFAYNDAAVPEGVRRYQFAVRLVKALSEAAAFVDPHQAEATFLGTGRLRIPIIYETADLAPVVPALVEELETFVFAKIHQDQKLAILSSTVIDMCKSQPEPTRFRFLLTHLRDLVARTQDGYKLFASEFSYEKIRGKTEEAISDYTGKIHKTFHDIQNQVMGVPVATVIVATQFKAAAACGIEFWANLAISIGATLFVMLLTVAIYNQLMTLRSIEDDLVSQEGKLAKDYASIADTFLLSYAKLKKRVRTHRWVLLAIIIVSWLGVILTWYIYSRLTVPAILCCLPTQ
ncbi:hypothetical protein [Rhizobium sp. CECT 9324]|uniref:hypothetical protein n=1 Tax=Rhizobium sp. CECT 9324 TaxID=2845820 RepID=UPI001E616F3C|nr:hypothetical protein [Rhizobium sp. CECT 9324]CAH0338614.1 hypothetical protein RHI9324_00236 [Rhizobium sp. CECT 9324]